jgi:hypothetical protein
VLAGLDVGSPRFALLPPHFPHSVVSDTQIQQCFPAYRTRTDFVGVLRFVLPSLLYHHDALVALLPKAHRVHMTRFFLDADLRKALRAHVVSGLDSPHLKASGIPPHVLVLRQGAAISDKIDQLTAHLVPARADAEQSARAQVQVAPTLSAPPAPARAFTPSGFPLDFEFPIVSPFGAWRLLLRGNKALTLPPYRLLRPEELPTNTAVRKRLSDWLWFLRQLTSKLGTYWTLNEDALFARLAADDDERELSELFDKAWRAFDFDSLGSKTTARPDQWKFATAVLKMRELARGAGTLEAHLAKAPTKAPTKRTRNQRTPVKEKPDRAETEEEAPRTPTRSPPPKLFAAPRKREMMDQVLKEPENMQRPYPVLPKPKSSALDYASYFQ